jgi:hypothetical protein
MIRKLLKILLIFFSLIFLFFLLFNIGSKTIGNNQSLMFLKRLIPEKIKTELKNTIFSKKTINNLNKNIKNLEAKIIGMDNEIYEVQRFLVDNNIFTFTFKGNKTINKNYKVQLFQNEFFKNTGPRAFFDVFQEDVILMNGNGNIFYSKFDNFKDNINDDLKFSIIKTNISKFIDPEFALEYLTIVKDFIIIEEKIFVSYIKNDSEKGCLENSILQAKFDYNEIFFEEFFSTNVCNKIYDNQVGGRLSNYKDNNILLTIGDWLAYEGVHVNIEPEKYVPSDNPQNKDSLIGKIISINIETKKFEILAMGSRNADGVFYDIKNDLIIWSEHGPKGGDEINLLRKEQLQKDLTKNNYGWPISSYGEHYAFPGGEHLYKIAPLNKSHEKYGFVEPLKYFVPSLGPSQLIKINNKIYQGMLGWDLSRDGVKSILVFTLNDKFNIIAKEKVFLGSRVRDIKFHDTLGKMLIFLEEDGIIALLEDISPQ